MTRAEHVQWAKDRALEYLPHEPAQALTSMLSDMSKHDETKQAGELMGVIGMCAVTGGPDSIRRWIEGFN